MRTTQKNKSNKSQGSRVSVPSPNLGETLERVVFEARSRPMSRDALYKGLEPIFPRWLRSTCVWESGGIGDYRFVVFSTMVAPRTQVYVQFWSEPIEPVLWEVSSGRWNPPADKWLAGERSRRIEALGFGMGGDAENYGREVRIATPAQIIRTARMVVDIFYSAFDYRGLTPINAMLVHESRAEEKPTLDALTPEDLSKLFTVCGFRVEELEREDDEEAPMLRCRKRGTWTMVTFDDRVPDQNAYQRVRLSCEMEISAADGGRLRQVEAKEGQAAFDVSTVLPFSGGVTSEWVVERILEWDAKLKAHRRQLARQRVPTGEAVTVQ